VKGDFLYLKDSQGNKIQGRTVSDGDEITVLDISYSRQLALVQYPTGAGYRQGYVTNATNIIKYKDNYSWVNGSTSEAVYDLDKTTPLGSLNPRERAVILYKVDGMTAVAYDTGKGKLTKSGLVHYAGAGSAGGTAVGTESFNGIAPGEKVPGGFSYPTNAKVVGDELYLRDKNGNRIAGRSVSDGDEITVLDISYSRQLALVQYPSGNDVRQGYITNATNLIKYKDNYSWVNGSTSEIVYDLDKTTPLGSLNPRERAVVLYKVDGMTAVAYDTGKGKLTKSGLVHYEGSGNAGGSTSGGSFNGIIPGEKVSGGFSYPPNAEVVGDELYLRDENGNRITGRSVSVGDKITVLDISYSRQLALVQYPSGGDVRQGYVTNATKLIRYFKQYQWHNGSSSEEVLDANGQHLGSLSPYESATPLYEQNGMIHVVYNTDKGPNTKSGFVKYEGLGEFKDTDIQIPSVSHPQVTVEQYGVSGKGRPLNVYKIGNGSKVLFAGFAIHGWEDNWDNDGLALVKIANSLVKEIGDYKEKNGLHGWTVYIAHCMNPDGVIVDGIKDGPGRCAVSTMIDVNRCFPYNFKPMYSPRNYTGEKPLGAPEAVALKNLVERIHATSSEMVVIDFHGWLEFTQGNPEIGRYFGNQFGFGHYNTYASGFFSSWANSLSNTKGVLVEYPKATYSFNDVLNGNYIGKTFNAIINILKNNPNGEDIYNGSSDKEIPGSDKTEVFAYGMVSGVDTSLNVRKGPGTTYKIIGSLVKDTKVELVYDDGVWYKIKYGTGYGYVHSDYITKLVNKDEIEEKPKFNVTPDKLFKTVTINKNGFEIKYKFVLMSHDNRYHLMPATYDDYIALKRASAIQLTPKELLSLAIGFSPLDVAKDVADFIFGKDIITGEKINRGVALACIILPGALDTVFKKGVKEGFKNTDEIVGAFKKEKLALKSQEEVRELILKSIKKIDEINNLELDNLIEKAKTLIPTKTLQRGNLGCAKVNITGLSKTDFYSHSQIQNLDNFAVDVKERLKDISILSSEREFKTLCVNKKFEVNGEKAWDRKVDSESKILEEVNRRLNGNMSASGGIILYTDLYPCDSCIYVMEQFKCKYPNINIEIVYKK
ncbi:hypothetical protein BFS06_16750, partial [Clostridium perfringens]